MNSIMSYDEWMQQTRRGIATTRSRELKALDTALKEYQGPGPYPRTRRALQDLHSALEAWKRSNGDWKNSTRNKFKTVETLDVQIKHVMLNTSELVDGSNQIWNPEEALRREAERQQIDDIAAFIREEREHFLEEFFTGAKLKPRFSNSTFETAGVASNLRKMKQGAEALGATSSTSLPGSGASRVVDGLVSSLFDGENTRQIASFVAEYLGNTVLGEFIASATPYAGHVMAAGSAIKEWTQAAHAKYREVKMQRGIVFVDVGTPQAAAEAVHRLIRRELTHHETKGTIHTADFGARTGALFLDAGIASQAIIGGISAMAQLTQVIFEVGRDYVEMKAGNALLADPKSLDLHMFEKSPLLGAYVLTNCDTSYVVNMFKDFGERGWMGRVEFELHEHIRPVLEQCERLKSESRLELRGVEQWKGQQEVNEDNLNAMRIRTARRRNAR